MANGSYSWETMKKMFNSRVFATPLQHNNNVFVIGGCDQKGIPLDAFEYYETAKRKWHNLANMPTKRAAPAAQVIQNKIVVIGGVGEDQEPVDKVEIYDIETKKWETMEPLTEPLQGMASLVKDNKILMLGGMSSDKNPRDTFWSYEVDTNKWRSLPPMPTPRYSASAFEVDNKIYVIGGRQGKLPNAAFEVFDFETQKWEKLQDVPTKRVFPSYIAVDHYILSIGGLNQPATEGFSDVCEVFDITGEKKEWETKTKMPRQRADFAVGVVGGKVICAGGLGSQGKPLQIIDTYDWENDTWTEIKSSPTTHCSCASIMINGKLFIIGGLSLGGPSSSMEVLSCKPDAGQQCSKKKR